MLSRLGSDGFDVVSHVRVASSVTRRYLQTHLEVIVERPNWTEVSYRCFTRYSVEIGRFDRTNGTFWRTLRNKLRKDTLLNVYKTLSVLCCI